MNKEQPVPYALNAENLSDWTGGKWDNLEPSTIATGFCLDTRIINFGEIFLAFKTDRDDGHRYLAIAKKKGAKAAIVTHPEREISLPQLVVPNVTIALEKIAVHRRQGFKKPVIAITGSCGKTSSKDILKSILGKKCWANKKNFNNTLGVPLTLSGLDPNQYDYAVIEAGISEPKEMGKLGSWIQADSVLVTMIGNSHLEKLESPERIAREKAELFHQSENCKRIYYPSDCLKYDAFSSFNGEHRVLNRDYHFEYFPTQSDDSKDTHTVCIHRGNRKLVLKIPKLSEGMTNNLMQTIVLAQDLGFSDSWLKKIIIKWKPTQGRGRWIEYQGAKIYFDAYNANPDSMQDGLSFFQKLTKNSKKRIFILGDMGELGDFSKKAHQSIYSYLECKPQDHFFLFGSEMRNLKRLLDLDDKVIWFQTIEELLSWEWDKNTDYFIKGSRSMKLEKILPQKILREI